MTPDPSDVCEPPLVGWYLLDVRLAMAADEWQLWGALSSSAKGS